MRKILDKEISLLLKEANMAESCLGEGLTNIRKSSTEQPGRLYMASLLLSNGLERLMKIILIQNFRLKNEGNFPTNNYLKNKGHNLSELYENIIQIKKELKIENLGDVLKENGISNQIFEFLNDFAKGARYYNLDELTNSNVKSSNPLKKWDDIGNDILNNHKKKKKSKNEKLLENNEFKKIIQSTVITLKFDSNNEICRDTWEDYNKYKYSDFIQGYCVYYILKIIKYLNEILYQIEKEIGSIPFTNEFFECYMIVDSEYYKNYEIRKRKKWSMY